MSPILPYLSLTAINRTLERLSVVNGIPLLELYRYTVAQVSTEVRLFRLPHETLLTLKGDLAESMVLFRLYGALSHPQNKELPKIQLKKLTFAAILFLMVNHLLRTPALRTEGLILKKYLLATLSSPMVDVTETEINLFLFPPL